MLLHSERSVRYFLSLAILLGMAAMLAGCPQPPEDLDGFIEYQMDSAAIPGLSACIVKGQDIVWSNSYGWANIEEERAVTTDTLFQLASVSKTVTGTTLMQLYEQSLLDLDDDINDYLPFAIRNPNFPDAAITFRMLLTHHSSLQDNAVALGRLYNYDGDSPISLREIVEGMFTPEGQWYNTRRCFCDYAPGGGFTYTNLGFALIGFLIECISGESFDEYCNVHIFEPLGMDETSWFVRDLDPTHIAMPYRERGVLRTWFEPYGQFGYPDYPSGQLRTSVNQFARFLAVFINGGAWHDTRILQPESVTEMLTLQGLESDLDQGLVWFFGPFDGHPAFYHGGAEQGVISGVCVLQDAPIAVYLVANGDATAIDLLDKKPNAINGIMDRLIEEAQQF